MARQSPRNPRSAHTSKVPLRIDDIIARNTGEGAARPAQRYDLVILQALRRIVRAIDIHSHRLKITHDLTAPQLICLLAVVEDGPLTPTLLAERVHLSPSTLVGIVDRLEKKDLVTRTRSDRDRRVVYVGATPKARRLAAHAPSPLQEGLARALLELSEREQATIARSLERIVDLMEARDIEAAPILDTGDLNGQ